ncbi:MAG: hypothetical protein ACOCW3_02215 [Spirochaetota bacterium]
MKRSTPAPYPVDVVQERYARVLSVVVVVDLVILGVGLLLYASGALPSSVTIGSIPELWHLSAEELTTLSGTADWSWVETLGEGRSLAFASLVAFPASMIVMTAVATTLYLRHRRTTYAAISAAVLAVFVAAAIGLVS